MITRKKPLKAFLLPIAACAVGLSLLSGCVYTRLLEVKRQLRDFDSHYAVQGDPDLAIFCKTPVMFSKDMVYLIGGPPLTTETRGEISHWRYEFERVPHPEDKEAWPLDRLSLDFKMLNGKVQSIIVPESFLRIFPRPVVVETLRKAPDAEVLQLRKTLVARNRLSPEADAQLPDREKTLSLLGKPLRAETAEGLETLIYRYRIAGVSRNVPIIARLSFSPDGLLRRTVIHWDTSTMDVVFLRPGQD